MYVWLVPLILCEEEAHEQQRLDAFLKNIIAITCNICQEMGGEFFRKELNINSYDICKNGILYGFKLHISDFVNIS